MTRPRFKRILLKLSGEVLMGDSKLAIDPEMIARVAGEIAEELRSSDGIGVSSCVTKGSCGDQSKTVPAQPKWISTRTDGWC